MLTLGWGWGVGALYLSRTLGVLAGSKRGSCVFEGREREAVCSACRCFRCERACNERARGEGGGVRWLYSKVRCVLFQVFVRYGVSQFGDARCTFESFSTAGIGVLAPTQVVFIRETPCCTLRAF